MSEKSASELRDYEHAKFELAEILRVISVASAATDRSMEAESGRREISELFTRLAEDRFVLLVVGRFSRGKSSLMNAILGMDRLPTGILPLTSVITSVSYGSIERVQINFESGGVPKDISMDDLPDYITERGNPGNGRRIRIARIELPAEILRRGFHFVDSPGLGSAIRENSRTTESYFPEADAAVVVSGFDGPLTEDEIQAIRTFAETGRAVFVVLNKQDLLPASGRCEVLAFARERLAQIMPSGQLRLFPTSAQDGIAARMAGDEAAFAASGVATLESALIRFLIEDKRRLPIAGLCDRMRRLIDQLGGRVADDALRSRLGHVRERWHESLEARERSAADIPDARMEECLLCSRVRATLYEFLRKHQYELAVSPQAREALAAARGLCGPHFWLYASMAADRDICLALTPLMKWAAHTLQSAAARDSGSERLSAESVSELRASCGLCAIQQRVEVCATEELLQRRLSDKLPTVCAPHLRWIAGYVLVTSSAQRLPNASHEVLAALLHRQAAAAARLAEDMQRYVLRRDGTRRALVTDEEARAAQRALAFLAGARGVSLRD